MTPDEARLQEIEARAAAAYSGDMRLLLSHMGKDRAWLAAKLREAWAVVEKLPKCWRLNEAGKLVRDVSVVPGMTLWMPDEGAGADDGFVACDIVRAIYDTGQVEFRWSGPSGGREVCPMATNFHSTREAALATMRWVYQPSARCVIHMDDPEYSTVSDEERFPTREAAEAALKEQNNG